MTDTLTRRKSQCVDDDGDWRHIFIGPPWIVLGIEEDYSPVVRSGDYFPNIKRWNGPTEPYGTNRPIGGCQTSPFQGLWYWATHTVPAYAITWEDSEHPHHHDWILDEVPTLIMVFDSQIPWEWPPAPQPPPVNQETWRAWTPTNWGDVWHVNLTSIRASDILVGCYGNVRCHNPENPEEWEWRNWSWTNLNID